MSLLVKKSKLPIAFKPSSFSADHIYVGTPE